MPGELVQAVILGVMQGLTEFLPVSSSAHLILVPWLLGWRELGILFDVVIHGGTLLAVVIYFREDWRAVARQARERLRDWRNIPPGGSLVDALVVGTVPAILAALLARGFIEDYARKPVVTVVTLPLFGILLWWADRRGRGARPVEEAGFREGLVVGCAQALALIPGVSRSGITITAALLLGFRRPDSARLSFLLAGPIIALGAANGVLEIVTAEAGVQVSLEVLAAGVLTSSLVGYLCIKYFLGFLKSHTVVPFVVYRILLAAVILLLALDGFCWRG